MKGFIPFELTDAEYNGMAESTRRKVMERVMILDTPKYRYVYGAQGGWWRISRYDVNESIGGRKWQDDYEPTVTDLWL